MLTISQDWIVRDGQLVEHARSEGREVFARSRATCLLAANLLRAGLAWEAPVRVVRADPYIFPAPHNISGVSLGLVSQIDFFALTGPAMRDEIRRALGLADQAP